MAPFPFFDHDAVVAALDYPGCIAAVREAMRRFSVEGVDQPLRQIVETAPGKLFALMPGGLGGGEAFGAKVITAFADPARAGRSAHRGVAILFDPASGAVAAIGDAAAITDIRTACASAVATGALARADATTLGLFGCGALAASHLRALALVRPLSEVRVWGRDAARVAAFVTREATATGLPLRAAGDPREAAACDIVTTVTGAATPILLGEWVREGAHVNIVGSSHAGPVEVDTALVARSRYIADSRRSALAAAAEFLVAKAAGAVGDDHIAGEIGEVLAGMVPGRESARQVTLYKSLGHVVQDLAALRYLVGR
ncbi:ornithine cyclodeaminase family protein [Sphingomonas adhaesiva]|uniref:ornithine cyclodeaminase family protein n=1 Tax=Sphingomonas adhaesiva TaxID=28212 RepID=UPI002FFA7630